MTEDPGLFDWAFKGLVTILFTIGGWLWLMLIGKVKEQDGSIQKNSDSLKDHQLYTAQTYTTKTDSNRQYDDLSRKLDKVIDMLTGVNPTHP